MSRGQAAPSHQELIIEENEPFAGEATQTERATEAGPTACYRHPRRETSISCSDCGRPICTDCMVYGAVGIKCPECARLPRSAIVSLKPNRAARAVAAAVLGGAAMGFGILILQGVGLFFALILGYLIGIGMAELVLAASGRYRGPTTGWIAAGGAIWAYVFPYVVTLGSDLGAVADSLSRAPFVVLGAVIAAYIAYQRTQ
jgi:hypothetical protein